VSRAGITTKRRIDENVCHPTLTSKRMCLFRSGGGVDGVFQQAPGRKGCSERQTLQVQNHDRDCNRIMRLRERDLNVKADHAQHYTEGPTHKSTYSPAQESSGPDDSSESITSLPRAPASGTSLAEAAVGQ
jgi:hypothetical protein